MQLWRDQSHRYRTEMLDFKKLTSETIQGLRNDHCMMSKDLEGDSVQLGLAEKKMDYLEAQNSPRACTSKADKVVEQEAWGLQGREEDQDWEELQFRVSGELY